MAKTTTVDDDDDEKEKKPRTMKRMQIVAPSGQVYEGTIQEEEIT